jgi:hypothetical protein
MYLVGSESQITTRLAIEPAAHLEGRTTVSTPTPYHFFLHHAGTSYNPQTETKIESRRRSARQLAAAERWATAAGLIYVWEDDPDCTEDDFQFPEDKTHVREYGAVSCRLIRPCPEHGADCKHAHTLESLSGITESLDNRQRDAYRRVVEAELALEAMPDDHDAPEVRHTSCRHCRLDIEGISPFKRGQWMDRGGNRRCNDGKHAHAPEGD